MGGDHGAAVHGVEAIGDGDPATLAATMQQEYGQWRQIVKEIGFVAD